MNQLVKRRLISFQALLRRELGSFFQTPVAYVVGAIFLGVTGALFFSVFFIFERAELRQFFGLLPMLLALLMPALAMRLIAEERRRGTWEILTTLPVGSTQIVLAKFLAVWITGLFLLAPTVIFATTVAGFGPIDVGPVIGGYLGAALLAAAYASVGVFASSVARNETVALVVGLVIALFLALLEGITILLPPAIVSIVQFFGTGYHFTGFAQGVIDTRSVVYLIALTAFFLILARFNVDRHRQQRTIHTVNAALLVAILVVVNLVSSNTFTKVDLTRNNAYSLSRVSEETLARVQDPLRVRVFYTQEVPAPYNGVRQYLTDLLREYDAVEDEYFSWEAIDVSTDEGRQEAQRYGLQQVEIQEIRSDEFQSRAVFMGAVVLYGNVVERVDRITSTDGLEYRLTTAIDAAVTQVDALAGSVEPVVMEVFASPTLSELQIQGLAELEAQMAAIHERVNADNYDRIAFEFRRPATIAEIRRLGREYGVRPVRWESTDGTRKEGLLEVVLRRGDRIERIPLEIFSQLFGGYTLGDPVNIEEAVRTGLRSLVAANPQVAYALGHGEKALEDYQQGAGPFTALAGERYEILPVRLAEEAIPPGIDTLILNGPTERYDQVSLYRIDQFLMDGGSLFVLLDSYTQIMPTRQQQMAGAQPTWELNETGLEELLASYGVEATDPFVLDEESFVARQAQGSTQLFQAPVLSGESLDRTHPITGGLQDVIVLNASELVPTRNGTEAGESEGSNTAEGGTAESDTVEGDTAETDAPGGATYTPLLRTSPRSWTVSNPQEIGPWLQGPPPGVDTGRRDVGVLLEGTFESFFSEPIEVGLPTIDDAAEAGGSNSNGLTGAATPGAEGAPGEEPSPRAEAAPATDLLETGRYADTSVAPGKVFVLSTSAPTTAQMLDTQNRTPNGTLLLNALDYLNGAPGIAELRSKGLGVPRITVTNPTSMVVARWGNVVLGPTIVIVIGLIVWSRRRTRSRRIQALFYEERDGD